MFNPTRAVMIMAIAIMLMFGNQVISLCQTPTAGDMQTWLDETLKHKIEAKYKGMEGNLVLLETADGTVKKIPYAKLSLSSQLKAKKLADPKSFEAPPLPSSYAAPPVSESPFSPDDTIEKYLEIKTRELSAGHADVFWHALPASSRADLESSIVRVAEILGTNTFKQIQTVLPNLHTIVKDKRSFIVGSPSIAAVPELAKILNQGLPALEPVINNFTKPATWNSENFKEGKVGPWLMLFANDMMAAAKNFNTLVRPMMPAGADLDPANVKFKVLEKTADTAKVEVSNGPIKQTVQFKKVDGIWLSELDKSVEGITAFKNYVDNFDQAGRDELKKRVRDGLIVANTILGPLAKAKTQLEFNQMFEPFAAGVVRGAQAQIMQARQNAKGLGGPGMGGQPGMGGPPGMGGMPGGSGSPSAGQATGS